jgi:(1->4)-alpha-D-glucan 1-alpha-D-glucosylmutase
MERAAVGRAGAPLAMPAAVPRSVLSTYRLQLHAGFDLDAAAALADYLADLGISHLYCSPYLQAAAGSTHGYDVADPTRVSRELGGEAAHERLCRALAHHGLGQVLDIVPNHMTTTDSDNRWWWDVLENGPASRHADWFDVDWQAPQERLRNLVLLPILGDHYGRVLEAGELRLVRRGGRCEIHHHAHRLPVAPRSLDELLRAAACRCAAPELAFLADAFGALPEATATDRNSISRRHRDKEVLAGLLDRLLAERPDVAAAVDAEVAIVNGEPDRLDALLGRQNYRLAFWRLAGSEIDYRRFFDVSTLVGLRVEDERVFAASHALVLDWVRRGLADGLRVDHPDGLYDPAGYCRRLRAAAPGAWLVVEKILQAGERLPADWPVDGTTGYDFLNLCGGLFVDPAGEAALSSLYVEVLGGGAGGGGDGWGAGTNGGAAGTEGGTAGTDAAAVPVNAGLDWPEIARAARLQILTELLAADVNRLAELLLAVCEANRRQRDHSRQEMRAALCAVAAGLAVYRTYVRAADGQVDEVDRRRVRQAVAAASRHLPELSGLLEFLGRVLLLEVEGGAARELAMRFQQLSAPAMAKGVEDTAFYVFNRLVSLNEVGGDPGRFGVATEEFHRHCGEVAERWPRTLLTTSTHDTKRGEDVRARLALLSEIPELWAATVRRWRAHNACHRRPGAKGRCVPDANAEYLLYQTLVGAWPLGADRVAAYMEKAAREARTHTSWHRPRAAYEEALRGFAAALAADAEFQRDLAAFTAPLVGPGRLNSLAQALLRLTAPGVPDLYQGCELWSLSLVDPDNRRPVDFARRRELLAGLAGATPETVLAGMDDGLPKLWLIRQALRLRRARPDWFAPEARYRPLAAAGPRAAHAVAFCRAGAVVAVAPRLVLGLGGDWGETTLDLPLPAGAAPAGAAAGRAGRGTAWRNELTGEELPAGPCRLADLLRRFPVALLAAAGEGVER